MAPKRKRQNRPSKKNKNIYAKTSKVSHNNSEVLDSLEFSVDELHNDTDELGLPGFPEKQFEESDHFPGIMPNKNNSYEEVLIFPATPKMLNSDQVDSVEQNHFLMPDSPIYSIFPFSEEIYFSLPSDGVKILYTDDEMIENGELTISNTGDCEFDIWKSKIVITDELTEELKKKNISLKDYIEKTTEKGKRLFIKLGTVKSQNTKGPFNIRGVNTLVVIGNGKGNECTGRYKLDIKNS
ncbi:hypothetical protein [Vulcanibacillus modesticaldus]|uniref:hypothetical protein n=1 Tax=Vulcanibacillus modesticaldus TaxID=337097 RepID=UPI00114C9EC5|nr:hypothetical protein [Vulcanibacillus modesticaldus]